MRQNGKQALWHRIVSDEWSKYSNFHESKKLIETYADEENKS